MHRSLWFLIAGPLLAGAACAHVRGVNTAGAPPWSEAVRVSVTDNYALPMEIYASGSGITRRLGLVYPGLPSSFQVPQAVLVGGGEVEFAAQPSGHGGMFRAYPMTVMPGDVVEFVIMTNLIGSHADVAAPSRR